MADHSFTTYIVSTIVLLLHLPTGTPASWYPEPHFMRTDGNVTVTEGEHAFLPCRVANLGDRSVTWMRKRTLHIISAGTLTYSPDDRYRVLHPPGTDEWTLHIKFAQKADAGWYECQVNADPKITRPVRLIVIDKNVDDPFYLHEVDTLPDNSTIVELEGPAQRFIQLGSVLAVTCIIKHEYQRGPAHVTWYHGGTKLDYDSPRGGISLQTEKTATRTVSKLLLSSVQPGDSGRYSCRPHSGGLASVTVHVQADQQQAAVQQSSFNTSINSRIHLRYVFLLAAISHIILLHTYYI
ncbi:zwei Ig domain protein zig-8 [Hyalella azteca]|uniref:Zwei Ig domain protein zig-8 n=1 Tax=Hyalella azteca TaxID=294128 RepID=A0A8B7NLP0_HYAAZ|nr:zwei Ig domain protein zig-8 [Hyalella azteca]